MTEFQPIEKICRVSGQKFTIYPEDQEFYTKKGVSLPTLAPLERARRRFAFINNELALYRRHCAATGKDLITFYHPATPAIVYDREYWLSDEFDPFKSGRDYDFNRSFFAQWQELYWQTPTFHTAGINNENGDYILYGHGNKNSFLVCGFDTENCMYGMFFGGKDSLDCAMTYGGESLYECSSSKNCYELFYGDFCQDCRESRFLYDCVGCNNCIMCVGLRHKNFCLKNKQLTKEEYEREKNKYELGSYINSQKIKAEYLDFLRHFPLRENNNVNCENCVGDFLRDAKNCYLCFNGTGSRDTRYGIPYCNMETGCLDTDGTGAVDCYECNCYASQNVLFSKGVLNCHDIYYSIDIMGQSHDLFGCVNLKGNNEYCILNKRYSKDDYFALREQIIAKMKAAGEWGEHLPMTAALFPYYDSYSANAWPLAEKDIIYNNQETGLAEVDLGGADKAHLNWRPILDFEKGEVSGYNIADNVQDYSQESKQKELLNSVLVCDKTGRKYRIQSRELYFYLKHNIAIPRESFHARHSRRIRQLMRCDIHPEYCDNCGKNILTIYNQKTDGRQIFCADCYQKTVI